MAKRQYYSRTAALIGATRDGGRNPQRRRRKSITIRWKVVLPVVLSIGALFALLFIPNFWFLESDTFKIHGMPIELHGIVQGQSGMYGNHSLILMPRKAERTLKELYPDMLNIEMKCNYLPAKCDLYFTHRTPVVAWVTPYRTVLIDITDDIPYAFRGTPEAVDLPVVNGLLPDGNYAETALRQALEGIKALEQLGIPVDNLTYDPLRGLIWADEAGRLVVFGMGPEMRDRWNTYQDMLVYFESMGVFPVVIDVRFPAGVTYRLEGSR